MRGGEGEIRSRFPHFVVPERSHDGSDDGEPQLRALPRTNNILNIDAAT